MLKREILTALLSLYVGFHIMISFKNAQMRKAVPNRQGEWG